MNPRQYIVRGTITAVLLFGSIIDSADADSSPLLYSPPSFLLQVNGETYQEKNADTRRAPASLTKIMTALVVMEKCSPDEIVKVSRNAARETGSRIGLRRGDRLTVRDLLAATLIASANDAARALADYASGSQKAFVVHMNAHARRLHLHNTQFTNVCGHDHAKLYSSANDLAVLAEHALKHPLFAELVERRVMLIKTVNGGRTFVLKNKNRLIGTYPGARGVKTGTTPKAGQCLVALAKRDDKKVLLVIMHARHRWQIAPAMLDAAFAANSSARAR
jgi:D-alanyl-D-alanine carboxypeptidase (penicillin-binding protein 5/6)